MPSLSDHTSDEFVKALYIGGSGSGKTGSLASLVNKSKYKLKVIDMDNGVGVLKNFIREGGGDTSLVDYETRRDKYKASSQGNIARPTAYRAVNKLLDEWTDGSNPAEWGADTILVLDSLTSLGKAAYNFAAGLNPSYKDKRMWYFDAQELIDSFIATLTDEDFRTNVVVISHIDFVEDKSGAIKGWASSIGTALGPKLPRYFNNLIACESRTIGKRTERKIITAPTSMLDLKTEAPMRIGDEYSVETGMAEIFDKLKGK